MHLVEITRPRNTSIEKIRLSSVTVEFPDDIMIDLIIRMATIEKRTAAGASEAVQLNSLVSAFQRARNIEV